MAKTTQKSTKNGTNSLEGPKRQGCVFHTKNRRGKPRTIKAKRCVVSKGGRGGEEECLPVEIRWDTCKFCLNWLKNIINILEGQTLQSWEGRGVDGRRPKSSNKHEQQQQEHKQQEKQQQAAESRGKQHKQQPRNSEGCLAEGGPAEGPRRVGAPKGGGPEGWGARRVGGPKGGGPEISRFFFPRPPLCSFFLPLLGVVSWNFGGVIEGRDPQMCTFGVLGLSCEAPAAPKHHLRGTLYPKKAFRTPEKVAASYLAPRLLQASLCFL